VNTKAEATESFMVQCFIRKNAISRFFDFLLVVFFFLVTGDEIFTASTKSLTKANWNSNTY